MIYIIIPLIAFFASLLTLFSGFGLGTILMPIMAIFFPLEVAITLTAVVHLSNNLFKFALLGKSANWRVVLAFGLPAILAAFIGAAILISLKTVPSLFLYKINGHTFEVTYLKLIVAGMILFFLLLDIDPNLRKMSFPPKFLPVGGAVSGFFGGLSGHQGAFRSAFLLRLNLTKEAFVSTGVVIAALVDCSRLFAYSKSITPAIPGNELLLTSTIVATFLGVYCGTRLLPKLSMAHVQMIVSWMLFAIAVLLAMGVV